MYLVAKCLDAIIIQVMSRDVQ